MVFAEFGNGQVLWSMIWFTLFFIWIWLLMAVFVDIFRSPDLSGWGKGLWSVFIIVLPYLGVFVYLIARGHKMTEHSVQAAQAQDQQFRAYVRDAAGTTSTAVDQLETLSSLRAQGAIDEAEYQRMKAKITTA